MEPGIPTGNPRDILSRWWLAVAFFWLPAIAILVAGRPQISAGWRTVVWSAALAIMGVACTVNALRCGRVHCYATGPFFLVMAAVTLLYGLGVLPLGSRGWSLIGLIVLAGAMALCFLPELLLGKYRRRCSSGVAESRISSRKAR